jgi:hypothetical protein
LQHPNKALFNFGSPETTMSTRYHGTLLDHLADFMIYLSSTSLFWFSLNLSYDHGCHLSKRLDMTPKDYEYLLVATDLAQFHKIWGFQIKLVQWEKFIEGHRLITTTNYDAGVGTFEVVTKKIDLYAFINGMPIMDKNKNKCHFIWIGILNAYSPRKIEMQNRDCLMIVTPPRLNGHQIKQQSFRQCTEKFKWN